MSQRGHSACRSLWVLVNITAFFLKSVYAYSYRCALLSCPPSQTPRQHSSQVNRWDAQDYAITLLRKFATDRNVHVTLVIHPRKVTASANLVFPVVSLCACVLFPSPCFEVPLFPSPAL